MKYQGLQEAKPLTAGFYSLQCKLTVSPNLAQDENQAQTSEQLTVVREVKTGQRLR